MVRQRWSPPPHGWFKVNSDASIRSNGSAGLGGAIRNSHGEVFRFFSQEITACTEVLTAEALACRHGVFLALNAGIKFLLVEVDNKNLAYSLDSGCVSPSPTGTIIADIIHMAAGFEQVSFKWTKRETNALAHRLASLACTANVAFDLGESLPESLKCIVMADVATS